VTASGGEIHFVYIPSFYSFKNSAPPSRKRVLAMLHELNFPIIDFYQIFKDSGDPLKYFPYRSDA